MPANAPEIPEFSSDGWTFAAFVVAAICIIAPFFFKHFFTFFQKDRESKRKFALELLKFDTKLVNRTKKSKEESDMERMLRKIETQWDTQTKKSKEANESRSPERRMKRGSDDFDD